MTAETKFYMPILKSKKGELEALKRVSSDHRDTTFPLIECTTLALTQKQSAADALKKRLDTLAASLAAASSAEWRFGIDTTALLPTYSKQGRLLMAVCRQLAQGGVRVAPCLLPDSVSQFPAEVSALAIYGDIILRIPVHACLPSQVQNTVGDTWKALKNKRVRLHVLLDMYVQVGTDPAALAASMKPYVAEALSANHVSTVVLAGGSFPYVLTGIPQGQSPIARVEWQVWRKLLKDASLRSVLFGDYTVTNPKPMEDLDPRKINASAAIRYAQDDHWVLFKAGGTRTHGFGQYNALCKLLIGDKCYSGQNFSYGDERYHYHAQPKSTSGNLWTWRRDATSHHMALTARAYAKLAVP